MPIRSLAQASWMKHHKPEMYKEWLKETPNVRKLPMHVKKPKKKK